MEPQTYAQLAAVEDRHWWHRSREKLVAHYLRRLSLPRNAAILDIGCGTGGTTRFLQQYGRVTALDLSPLALQHARAKAPQATLVPGDANDLDELFAPQSFDLVTLFDVVCHRWVRDELALLRKVQTLLKPGGCVLVTEGAHKSLMRTHDRLVMSKTRYALSDFQRFFRAAGLTYQAGQYFSAPALPICWDLAAGGRRCNGHAPAEGQPIAELQVPSRLINAAMMAYMTIESCLFRHLPVSAGIALLVMGRKTWTAPPVRSRPQTPAEVVAARRLQAARPAAPVLTR